MLYAPRGWARWAPKAPLAPRDPVHESLGGGPWGQGGLQGSPDPWARHRAPSVVSGGTGIPGALAGPRGGPVGPGFKAHLAPRGVQWGQEGTRVPGASADPRGGPVGPRPGPARPTWNHGGAL